MLNMLSGSAAVMEVKLESIWYGVVLAMVVVGISNIGAVDGAEGIYVFGDSFLDTGNRPQLTPQYGRTWPGYPANRWSDGRNQADYFAELFGLPTPTPFLHLQNNSQALKGVNFARSGAAVTYAFGNTPLDEQVDEMEGLVEKGVLAKLHLQKSVVVINIGVNDYDTRNDNTPFQESNDSVKELNTFVSMVVDGIALTIVRLHALGIRDIIVSNMPVMACTPLSTRELAYTACSTNSTILNETSIHNSLLQKRVKTINKDLKGVHVVIADQTKAFQELFTHGAHYGFVDPLTPCCHGNGTNLYNLVCGHTDSERRPIYTLCKDPSKAVLWDDIHPTDAGWKKIIELYASVEGFTVEGPKLNTWIRKYNV